MTVLTGAAPQRRSILIPTATKQAWGFMIGSTFFALSATPGLSEAMGTSTANLLCFIGAWFFTGAGFIQLILSGAVTVPVPYPPGRMVRAEWLTASTQSFGTLLFNVSTTGALTAKSLASQEHYVWNPDAGGSVAFLISGFFAFVAYAHTAKLWDPGRRAWWSVVFNFIGSVAFGVSAVGAYLLPSGATFSDGLAMWGTFIGALGFFFTSLIVLPQWQRKNTSTQ